MRIQGESGGGKPVTRVEPWRKSGLNFSTVRQPAALSFLVFLFFLVYSLLCFTEIIPFSYGLDLTRQPDGSWQVDSPNAMAREIGVHSGDRILRADGVVPDKANQINHAGRLELQAVSTGQTYILSEADYLANADFGLVSQLVLCLMALVFYTLGSLVFLQARQRQPATLFFLTCLGLALAFFNSGLSYRGQTGLVPLQLTGAIVAAATLFHFLLIFPKIDSSYRLPGLFRLLTVRRLSLLAYISAGLTILVTLVFQSSVLLSLHLLLFGGSAVLVIVIKAFLHKSGQASKELYLIATSVVLALVPYLMLVLLPNLLPQIFYQPPNNTISILFFLSLPAGTAYSIVHYQSLGITRFMRRQLIYFILALILFALYVIFLYLFDFVGLLTEYKVGQTWLLALFSLVAAFSFGLLQKWLNQLVDRTIFKDYYEYQQTHKRLVNQLVGQVKLEELVKFTLSEITNVLNIEFAALVIYRSGGEKADQVYYRKIFKQSASSMHTIMDRLSAPACLRLPQQQQLYLLWQPGYDQPLTAIEIQINSESCAVLTVGAKQNEEKFSATDATLLETLAGLLQVKLQNTLLIEELEDKVHELEHYTTQLRASKDALRLANEQVVKVGEAERIRLARELHDEPLQRLMLVLRQFDSCEEEINPRELFCWGIVEEVSTDLRTICFQLRPPILDDLGLCAALESLVVKTRKETNLTITLLPDFALEEKRLDPDIEVLLYRVAQEALQNAVKHARAQHITIELTENNPMLILRVRDDGKGFVMPYNDNQLLEAGHLGLVGCRERLNSLGGRLEICSRLNEGTTIEAQIECLEV